MKLVQSLALLCASFALAGAAVAQDKTTTSKARPAKAPTPVQGAQAVLPTLTAADQEQLLAAGQTYYGPYDCEFKHTIDIAASQKYPSYVDVKHCKADYLINPVLSSTGAIRQEDERGDTLMVQIASKSMLLNVKTAQRIVDDCVSPKQRELIEVARLAKAAAAASAAEGSGGSTPTTTK